eukprot:scaffold5642_cov17-Prasinocladus_malaysianus.AAC.1
MQLPQVVGSTPAGIAGRFLDRFDVGPPICEGLILALVQHDFYMQRIASPHSDTCTLWELVSHTCNSPRVKTLSQFY